MSDMFHHEDGSTCQTCFIMRTVLFNMHVSSWGAVLLVRPVSPWGTVLLVRPVSPWGTVLLVRHVSS